MRFLVGMVAGFLLSHGTLVYGLSQATQVRVEFPPGSQEELEDQVQKIIPPKILRAIPPLRIKNLVHEPTPEQRAELGIR